MRAPTTSGDERRYARPARIGLLLFTLAAILALTILGPLMSASDLPMTGEGSPLRQVFYLLVAAMVAFGLRPADRPQRLLAVPVALVVALAWCWLSLSWAIEPGIGLRRLVLTTVIIWSIFAACEQLGYEKTVLIMRVALAAVLIINFLVVLGWPDTGIHQADEPFDKNLIGDWRGIMTQKNFAGALSALAVIAFMLDARRIPIWLRVAIVAGGTFFLWKTGSRTSLGVCAGALLVALLFLRYNARYRLVVLPLTCIGLLAAANVTNFFSDPLAGLMEQRATLSGRVEIWDLVLRYSADHPMFGAGYGSFWNIGPASPVYQYAKGWVLELANGHNGFLDLVATVGIPGLIIVVGAAIVWPLVRLFSSSSANGSRGALILGLIVFCVAHNSTESSLFDRDAIGEVFLMIAIALLIAITRGKGSQRLTDMFKAGQTAAAAA